MDGRICRQRLVERRAPRYLATVGAGKRLPGGLICGLVLASLCLVPQADGARVAVAEPRGENKVLRIRDRTAADNRIGVQVVDRGAAVVVRDADPLDIGDGCVQVGTNRRRARCAIDREGSRGFVTVLVITRIGRGDDHFALSGRTTFRRRSLVALTDAGRGSDRVRGGEGSDLVIPGPGRDRVNLGYGRDQLLASARRDGADTINGDGRDTVLYVKRTAPVTVDLRSGIAGAPGENDRISGIRFAMGGRAGDRIFGDGKANELAGGGGNDLIRGGRGDDDLGGEAGVDELGGGPGQDFLFSDDGRSEFVDCGAGPDFAFADDVDVLNACEKVSTKRAALAGAGRFSVRATMLTGFQVPDAPHHRVPSLPR